MKTILLVVAFPFCLFALITYFQSQGATSEGIAGGVGLLLLLALAWIWDEPLKKRARISLVRKGEAGWEEALEILHQFMYAKCEDWRIEIFGADRMERVDTLALAWIGEEFVGIAAYSPSGTGQQQISVPTLIGVYVVRYHRRRGIGTQLVAAIVREHSRQKLGWDLEVEVMSEQSRRFLAKLPAKTRAKLHVWQPDQLRFEEVWHMMM